ncbi:MAG: RluA family pseudouridine synthase [Planctomycetia bacterium]|nr:RluA family pseudouridine synthase [Planctomycetia bacterium]
MSKSEYSAGFTVLREDQWCIAVSKPAGLLTQAPPGIDSLESRIKRYLSNTRKMEEVYLGVPHRLDRPASGCMIFAKTRLAARRLAEQFQQRRVRKVYWALVEGLVAQPSGHWVDYVRKIIDEPRGEVVAKDEPNAQRAELRYECLERNSDFSWLQIELLTGRMHQIRLQASTRGHPLKGDLLYGARTTFAAVYEDPRFNAIALHARKLELVHPVTEKPLVIEAPVNEVWQQLIGEKENNGTLTTRAV